MGQQRTPSRPSSKSQISRTHTPQVLKRQSSLHAFTPLARPGDSPSSAPTESIRPLESRVNSRGSPNAIGDRQRERRPCKCALPSAPSLVDHPDRKCKAHLSRHASFTSRQGTLDTWEVFSTSDYPQVWDGVPGNKLELECTDGSSADVSAVQTPSILPVRRASSEGELKRPSKTALDLLLSRPQIKTGDQGSSRMLVNVNVSGSAGPLRFLVSLDDTVDSVLKMALRAYAREGRLPELGFNHQLFDLFYSNSPDFEALSPKNVLRELGVRQFVMSYKRQEDKGLVCRAFETTAEVTCRNDWWGSVTSLLSKLIMTA